MRREERKILFIEPPFYKLFKETYSLDIYPLALGYLSGTVKKNTDWNVMSYNADFSPNSERMKFNFLATAGFDNYIRNLGDLSHHIWKKIEDVIREFNPAVVGISCKSQNFKSACNVAKIAKKINDRIIVVVGGPHPSMIGLDALKNAEIDIAVMGEGETTILEILDAVENGEEMDSIKGVAYRKNGVPVENPRREYIDDLDSLCFPHEYAREVLKDFEKYPVTVFRNIFAVRGCPNKCFFCGSRKIWSRRVRYRSYESVIKEINGLRRLGIKSIRFDDDTFGVTKKRIQGLCEELIKNCPGLKWSCEIHVNLVDDDVIKSMKKAGCHSIQVGIESGNNDVLEKIAKNITIEEALKACEIIKKHGVTLETFFIVGFPQDTEETIRDTFKAIKKVKSDNIIFNVFNPYPGTEAFELCREKNLIDDSYDCSLHNHQSPNNCYCANIDPKKFREICSEIEKWTDRANSVARIKKVFSPNTIWRIQEAGVFESVRKGLNIFLGK